MGNGQINKDFLALKREDLEREMVMFPGHKARNDMKVVNKRRPFSFSSIRIWVIK